MKKILLAALLALIPLTLGAESGTISSPPEIATGGTVTSGNIKFNDDIPIVFGSGSDAACRWETADANANELVCTLPEGDATNVPVFVFGDQTISGTDINHFEGTNDPLLVVFSDNAANYVYMTTDGVDSTVGNNGGSYKMASPVLINTPGGGVPFTISPTVATGIQTDVPSAVLSSQSLGLKSGASIAATSWLKLNPPTYTGIAGGSAETITDAATLYISAAPIQGADATVTNAYALWVDSGLARFDGGIQGALTGNADTASALAANPSDCAANQYANTIAANGNLSCSAIADADVPNNITIDLATAASALAANPSDCGANQYATTIAANGNLTCASIADADVPNNITVDLAAAATALAANPSDCGADTWATTIAASGNLSCSAITDAGVTNALTISGGTVNDSVIGGVTAAAITGTTITANTSVLPDANDGAALGSAGVAFSDLFLADNAYINFANGGGTINYDTGNGFFIFDREVHFGQGADLEGLDLQNVGELTATTINVESALSPDADGGASIGTNVLGFNDIWVDNDGIFGFGNGASFTGNVAGGITVSGDLRLSGLNASRALFLDADGDIDDFGTTTALALSLDAVTGSGSLVFGTNPTLVGMTSTGRVLDAQGADVGSANNLTLGNDGNVFEITGGTQINAITSANWQNGSVVTLLFTAAPTVKNNTSGGAGTIKFLLDGGVDFVATANDLLSVMLSEIGGVQAWREVSRARL